MPHKNSENYRQGLKSNKEENWEEATLQFSEHLNQFPDDYLAWHHLGHAKEEKEDYKGAIKAYEESLKLQQQDLYTEGFIGWSNLARIYYSQKDYDRAFEAYMKVSEVGMDKAETWYELGRAYEIRDKDKIKKNYDAPIFCFQKAVFRKPNATYYYYLGCAYDKRDDDGDFDRAIHAFKKALKLDENCVESWFNLGEIYRDKEEYDEAIKVYKKALSMNKSHSECWLSLGKVYESKSMYKEANDAYNKALSLEPDRYKYLNDKIRYNKQRQMSEIADLIHSKLMKDFNLTSEQNEKVNDILGNMIEKMDDIKNDTELIKNDTELIIEYTSKIENIFEKQENIEVYLKEHLDTVIEKLKSAWEKYKKDKNKNELVAAWMKILGKKIMKTLLGKVTKKL